MKFEDLKLIKLFILLNLRHFMRKLRNAVN